MQFTERSALEKGFAEVFQSRVRPKLMALETERTTGLRKAYLYVGCAIGFMLLGFGVVYAIWGGDGFFGYIIFTILGGGAAFFAWSVQSTGWNSQVEEAVMPAICEHVGDLHFDANGGHFPIGNMHGLNLLPNYDSSSFRNRMKGKYHDTEYELIQATLKRRSSDSKGRSKSSTVFSGLLFHIAVPAEAPGKIVLMRDRGGIGNKLAETFSFGGSRSMPKASFKHAAFEAAFEVYAEQPDQAVAFMPDPFLDAMLTIGDEQGGRRGAKSITAGFEGNSFFMALRRGGKFMKMGSLTTPVASMEDDLHAIFDDIALGHQIIDRLHGA